MKILKINFVFLALALVTVLASFTFASRNGDKDKKKEAAQIEWISFEEAEKRAKKKPKPVFVDVYTDWCGWCKKMDKDTFANPEVANYVNKNFYAVKFNAEGKDPVKIKGRTYTLAPGQRTHQLAIELLNGKMGYPTTVYLDGKLNVVEVKPGYLTPEQFMEVLTAHSTAYQSTKAGKSK